MLLYSGKRGYDRMMITMASTALGQYMRALRVHRGWTQAQLAEAVGVSGNTIYRIEKAGQEPEAAQLAALLTTLHGRIRDVQRILSGALTGTTPQQLADEAVAEYQIIDRIIANGQGRELAAQIAAVLDDPLRRQRLADYLAGLAAGSDRPCD